MDWAVQRHPKTPSRSEHDIKAGGGQANLTCLYQQFNTSELFDMIYKFVVLQALNLKVACF